MEQEKEALRNTLRGAGLKATHSRVAILDLLHNSDEPMDVQSILDALTVSAKPDQATVYRILRFLVQAGLVEEIHLTKGVTSYEISGRPHHHHLVCEKCGLVEDVAVCCENPKPVAASFHKVTNHSLEFSGICNACVH